MVKKTKAGRPPKNRKRISITLSLGADALLREMASRESVGMSDITDAAIKLYHAQKHAEPKVAVAS